MPLLYIMVLQLCWSPWTTSVTRCANPDGAETVGNDLSDALDQATNFQVSLKDFQYNFKQSLDDDHRLNCVQLSFLHNYHDTIGSSCKH
eukprot:g33282.t1